MPGFQERIGAIERTVVGALAGMLVIVSAMGALTWRQARQHRGDALRLERSHAALRDCEAALFHLKSAQAAWRGVILLGATRELAEYRASRQASLRAAASLARLLADDPALAPVAARLDSVTRGLFERVDAALADPVAGRSPARLEDLSRRRAEAARLALDITTSERKVLRRVEAYSVAHAERTRRLLFAALATALALALGAAWFARRLLRERASFAARLHAEQERLESILAQLDAVVVIKDGDGRLLYVNDAYEAALRRPRAELLGRRNADFMPPETAARIEADDRTVLESGRPGLFEQVIDTPAGRRTFLSHKVRLRGPDGSFQVCTFGTDITDRRENERRVEALNQELEGFASAVSHDLRAPLRAVDGFARILESDHGADLSPEAHRLLGQVRAGTARMARLIGDLLAFSRLKSAQPLTERVDMSALAAQCAREACAAEPARRVAVSVGELPAASGDGAMLAQVWRNLLSNAVKYTRPAAEPRVTVSARETGASIEYTVRDNGAGFDPAHAGRLFDIFSRLHDSRVFEGTGVGLALVRRIVERHGGTVRAEGAPGSGASFHFTLPRRPA
jgi:PAS domain S-box-containing protein